MNRLNRLAVHRLRRHSVLRRFFSDEPWTESVEYYDESGALLSTSPGLRPAPPSSATNPILSPAALAAFFLSNSTVPPTTATSDAGTLLAALSSLPPSSPSSALSLHRWAKRQTWYAPSDPLFTLLASRLSRDAESFVGEHAASLFTDCLDHISRTSGDLCEFKQFFNTVISGLTSAGAIEPAYSCFSRIRAAGGSADLLTGKTYHGLIALLVNKGLGFKAFEVLEWMTAAGVTVEGETCAVLVPALARSGRLDAAKKLFDGMRKTGGRPPAGVYVALADAFAKAGRLDAAVELFAEMKEAGHRPAGGMNASLIEALVKAGKLDAGMKMWEEMKAAGFRPSFGLYTMVVEANAKSGRLDAAAALFGGMERAGYFPMPATYACLVDMHAAAGNVDAAMRLYNSMVNAGMRPGMSTFATVLTALAKKRMVDLAGRVLLEMKAAGFPPEVTAGDLLMIFIKNGSTEVALKWLRFMGSAGIRTNNFIIRQLFEACMKAGMYEAAKPLLETYVESAVKVDLILYTSILAHLIRCQKEEHESAIMGILGATRHRAHEFLCELFMGPEQRQKPVLVFVREFFRGFDYAAEEGAVRYFVNVLLNYLVLMGQMNRARCVWKVAYENKLFPKAIVFDEHIAWSVDVRNLSVGGALVAVVHTLHRFRKRMLYYGVIPRRVKLVTGPTLKLVVAEMLASLESPFEVSKVVLRAPGDSVMEWFKKPIVQQFLLNEIPSKSDVLMHKLNMMFPSSAPELRSQSHPSQLAMAR